MRVMNSLRGIHINRPKSLCGIWWPIAVPQFRDKKNLPHSYIATAMKDFFSGIF